MAAHPGRVDAEGVEPAHPVPHAMARRFRYGDSNAACQRSCDYPCLGKRTYPIAEHDNSTYVGASAVRATFNGLRERSSNTGSRLTYLRRSSALPTRRGYGLREVLWAARVTAKREAAVFADDTARSVAADDVPRVDLVLAAVAQVVDEGARVLDVLGDRDDLMFEAQRRRRDRARRRAGSARARVGRRCTSRSDRAR